ncbi:MAG: hypothetical protein KDC87_13760 [Planctomycetes bacterium]|nr:hypothetical protein [Planctomycetota bacterium]MCB9868352.1 hypothetical protein [Planctomycetota bacterium]
MAHRDEPTEDDLAFTVATVWREERVSCPHPNILQAFDAGALTGGAEEFVRFHLEESGCPYCSAVLEDLRSQQRDADRAHLSGLEDRLLRSTISELRRASGA